MQPRSTCSRPASLAALWWLGLITLAVAWMSIAMSAAGAHELQYAPIIGGRDVQPRASQLRLSQNS